MNLNDLAGKVHLPSVVGFYGMGSRFSYHKIPGFGWFGRCMDSGRIFNFIDLYKVNSGGLRLTPEEVIKNAYQFYSQEHPELLESPVVYSETVENRLISDYLYVSYHDSFYRRCREEALNGNLRYNERNHKFSRLLQDLNMPELLRSGVGLITYKMLSELKSKKLPVSEKWVNKLLLPTFYSPDNRVATLEVCPLQDLSVRERIYVNKEIGWYGKAGETIVGNVKDLLTVYGCTWDRKLCYWNHDKPISLHHSVQPQQCLDIWVNGRGLATDKNPLDVLKETGQLHCVKDHLKDLSLSKIRELEEYSGQQLYSYWLAQRYEEQSVSGMRFSCRDGRYYYLRGSQWLEFTNFSVNLSTIRKEDGEWYQHGQLLMNDTETEFKVPRKEFNGQYALIQKFTDVLLEAGVGIPMIAPNLKHYLANVIDAFNTENKVEKPVVSSPSSEPLALNPDLALT